MKSALTLLFSTSLVLGSCSIDNLRSQQREIVLAEDDVVAPQSPTGNNNIDPDGSSDQVAESDSLNTEDPSANDVVVEDSVDNMDPNVDPNVNNPLSDPGTFTADMLGAAEIDECNKNAARLGCFQQYLPNLLQQNLDDCDLTYGVTATGTQQCLQYGTFIPGYMPVLQDITDCRANAGIEAPHLCLEKWLEGFDQVKYDACEVKYGLTDENMYRCLQFHAYVPGYQPTAQDITDCRAQFQDNQLALCIAPWNELVQQATIDACIANEGALATNIISCLRKGGFFKVDFAGEISPILLARCSTCHNAASLQWSYSAVPETLHATVGVAPRCVGGNEAMSMLLQKGSGIIAHAGGAALPVNSADQNIVKKWIEEGCLIDPTVYVAP